MHKGHFVLRCWSCITGPLGLNKEGSKEKIDEGLVQLKSPQCVAHLSFWLTKLLLDKFNSHVLPMTFWTFDGDPVLHNWKKMLFIIAHKCHYHFALAAPSGDGGGRTPIALGNTCPRPTNRHHHWLARNSNLGKVTWTWNPNLWKSVIGRKYGEEENWLGLRNESQDCKFVYGCIVLANTNITIFTLFILINSEEL